MNNIKKFKVYSEGLKRNMLITLRLPSVEVHDKVNYLYMHDGQNVLFDNEAIFGKSWDMDKHLSKLEMEKVILPTILVTVDCNQNNDGFERYREFSIYENNFLLNYRDLTKEYPEYQDGKLKPVGHEYLNFIVNELIPLEELTVNKRVMMGSSMGGLISHCAGLLYPECFDVLLCLSNAYWYHSDELIDMINSLEINKKQKYYLDVGTEEESSGIEGIKSTYIKTNKLVYEAMKQKTDNVELNIIKDGVHNEEAWSNRVEDILRKYLKEHNGF